MRLTGSRGGKCAWNRCAYIRLQFGRKNYFLERQPTMDPNGIKATIFTFAMNMGFVRLLFSSFLLLQNGEGMTITIALKWESALAPACLPCKQLWCLQLIFLLALTFLKCCSFIKCHLHTSQSAWWNPLFCLNVSSYPYIKRCYYWSSVSTNNGRLSIEHNFEKYVVVLLLFTFMVA